MAGQLDGCMSGVEGRSASVLLALYARPVAHSTAPWASDGEPRFGTRWLVTVSVSADGGPERDALEMAVQLAAAWRPWRAARRAFSGFISCAALPVARGAAAWHRRAACRALGRWSTMTTRTCCAVRRRFTSSITSGVKRQGHGLISGCGYFGHRSPSALHQGEMKTRAWSGGCRPPRSSHTSFPGRSGWGSEVVGRAFQRRVPGVRTGPQGGPSSPSARVTNAVAADGTGGDTVEGTVRSTQRAPLEKGARGGSITISHVSLCVCVYFVYV